MMQFSGPVARLCIGLVSLTLFLLLVVVQLFGVLRDDVETAQRVRKAITEHLAIQLVILIQKEDKDAVQQTLDAATSRGGEVLSIGIRRDSGDVYAQTSDHDRHWVPPKDGRSTITHVAVPLYAGKGVWGNIEVSFRPVVPRTILGWVNDPLVLLLVVMGPGGFLAYYWYMRRVFGPHRAREAVDRER